MVGNYNFATSIFTLPSSRTLYRYNTLDSNGQCGIIYQIFEQMKHEFNNRPESPNESTNRNYKRWKRVSILKFNGITIREHICYYSHARDIFGFENGVHDIAILMKETNSLDSTLKKIEVGDNTNNNENENENEKSIPNITQHNFVIHHFYLK